MKKKNTALAGALLLVLAGWSAADAAEIYTLDPIIVTAERTDTKELKTPAAVEIMEEPDIRATGATTVQEALKFSTGIIVHGQGPRNASQGAMFSKAVIRGNEKGTLVLVDGVPVSQNNIYNLNAISTDAVKRIEVVRGGGSVLYGSQATGGVINIITKGVRENKIKAGIGNYGIQNYAVSAQAGDKFGITYQYDHTGKISDISAPSKSRRSLGMYYDLVRDEHHNVDWRYNFNDHLYFTHAYSKKSSNYLYKYEGKNGVNVGAPYRDTIYSAEENLAALHYDQDGLKANLYYNRRRMDSENSETKVSPDKVGYNADLRNRYHSNRLDETLGIDISNRWHFKRGSFMLGTDFERDLAAVTDYGKHKNRPVYTTKHYQRNMYSIYGQMVYDFTGATKMNLNFRETWTEADKAGNKYDKFTPELVLTHDLDETTMVYAKAGKSFMMPTFSQLYGGGNIIGLPGLKPQTGKHFEIGLKKNMGGSSWRFALFHYQVKDFIDADVSKYPIITYKNADVKNTGIELDWSKRQNENLSYHVGLSYGHPQKQERDKNGVLGDWHDYYGKWQVNGGISHRVGKLLSSFEFNYLGKRIRDDSPYKSFKSQFFTDLNFSYQANENARFFLNIDNLFNRHDIISSSSSTFYNLGRNFLAGVEYKF